jgi:hypothetical protein
MLIVALLVLVIVFLYFFNDQNLEVVEYVDMNDGIRCIIIRDKNIVIGELENYQTLIDLRVNVLGCENYTLPPIDFDEKTLLGIFASGGGCDVDFQREVFRDDNNKEIIYNIKIFSEGTCEAIFSSMNWILIPKIPEDYEVEFSVDYK